ncbi:MAG: hypothetical protein HY900_38090 [Deltaproteobacteria bacterium]|nr:hypothetical protein [Deltaproteobacteria bacterium]
MREEGASNAARLVEVGWVIAGSLEQAHREALAQARARVLELVRRSFPAFEWRMPVVDLGAPLRRGPEEPVKLLEEGLRERERRGWDFVLVVTRTGLRSYYRPLHWRHLAEPSEWPAFRVRRSAGTWEGYVATTDANKMRNAPTVADLRTMPDIDVVVFEFYQVTPEDLGPASVARSRIRRRIRGCNATGLPHA